MNNNDSLGQLILCGVPGKELDAASAEMFRRVQPGGFILFGRNIESAPQLRKLIDDLRDLSEADRDAKLNDPAFVEGLSPEDREMLVQLAHLHVGMAPDPPGM